MAELTFKYTDTEFTSCNREVKKVLLDVPDDMNIDEFKYMCERLALSIGYQKKSIIKSFGKSNEHKEDETSLKNIIKNVHTKKEA